MFLTCSRKLLKYQI